MCVSESFEDSLKEPPSFSYGKDGGSARQNGQSG